MVSSRVEGALDAGVRRAGAETCWS